MTNIVNLKEYLLAIAADNANNMVAKKTAVNQEVDYVANIQKKASNIVDWLDGNKPRAPEGCYHDKQGLYLGQIFYKNLEVENQPLPFKLSGPKEVVRNYFTQLQVFIAGDEEIKKDIIKECKRLSAEYEKQRKNKTAA